MASTDSPKLNEGYQAEYGGLRLLVQQKEDSVKAIVFDKARKAVIWNGDAPNMDDAKDSALLAAREWLANPSESLPEWEPYIDQISNL
jgi:hypothetical protein